MNLKVVEVKASDKLLIEKVYQNEIESFGKEVAANMWVIMSIVRYGKLYVLLDEKDTLLSVAQFQGIIFSNEVFLFGFSTPKNQRKKGYGKFLLENIHEKLKNDGIRKIKLTVDPENEIAINMYENLSYKKEMLSKDEYGSGHDRYIMSKILI